MLPPEAVAASSRRLAARYVVDISSGGDRQTLQAGRRDRRKDPAREGGSTRLAAPGRPPQATECPIALPMANVTPAARRVRSTCRLMARTLDPPVKRAKAQPMVMAAS